MSVDHRQLIERLVEDLRSTGYSGREPRLLRLPEAIGRRYTAFRQLEVIAAQMAAVWLDSELEDEESTEFMAMNFLPRAFALVEIIDCSFTTRDSASLIFRSWQGVRRLLDRMHHSDRAEWKAGDSVVALLVGAMVLCQIADVSVPEPEQHHPQD